MPDTDHYFHQDMLTRLYSVTARIISVAMLIKRSNLTQEYADIYLLQSHSTCFRRRSTHHQEY